MKQTYLVALALLILPKFIFGQGPLTPPAGPAPTMKTLDQLKAGIPIDPSKAGFTTPYIISQPGNYYLVGNLAVTSGDAIDINVNGVSLDLNGFTISSTASPAGGYGIGVNATNNITILNGFIAGGVVYSGGNFSGPGFDSGIRAQTTSNTRVARVSVSGCGQHGIYLSESQSTVVDSCAVSTAGGFGIFAQIVKNSSASICGSIAIHGQAISDSSGVSVGSYGITSKIVQNCSGVGGGSNSVGIITSTALNCYGAGVTGIEASGAHNCYAYGTATGMRVPTNTGASITGCFVFGGNQAGISGSYVCTISDCTVVSGGTGIAVGSGSSLTNCAVQGCPGTGIILNSNSVAQNCTVTGNYGDGIATVAGCVGSSILNCNASGNGIGGTHDGIHLIGLERSNRVDGNNASNNTGIGIHQEDGPDLIVRNTARNNTGANYSPATGTSVGPIGTPNTATSPWANFQ